MNNKEKKKKANITYVLFLIICVLVGGVCGLFLPKYMDSILPDDIGAGQEILAWASVILGVYVAFLVQIVFHEAGHLVFGLLSGYHFCSFRVGSFMLVKSNGKFSFKRMSLAGTGGQCLMSPPDMKDGNFPVLLYNFGGSIANLVIGAVSLVLGLIWKGIPPLSLFFMVNFLFGLIFAATNGIPMRTGLVDNDGYNAISLTKNAEARRSLWIQLRVNEQITNGRRLQEMPEEWFRIPSEEGMKNSMTVVMAVFACNRLMDEHRFSEAEALMTRLLDGDTAIVGVHGALLKCDLLYCELIGENRSERVNTLLDVNQKKFMKAMKKFISIERTEYVYALLAEKNQEKAAKILADFESSARSYPYSGDIESERELMRIAADAERMRQSEMTSVKQ